MDNGNPLKALRFHCGRSALGAALLATLAVASASAAEGTLVVAVNQEPQDLAAQGAYKEINAPGLRNVVETLIAADPVSGAFKGILATDWEVVDDTTVRMSLREGVSFHDGTPFNAESAAHAVNFVWSADNAFTIQEYGGPGTITATPTGEHSIEIVSSEPDPLLEFRLSLNGISSMKQIEDNPAAHFDTPIGTGPYKFVEWVPGQYWSAEFNPDWWGLSADDAYGTGEPAFQELRFVFRPEDGARAAMAQSGEAQLAMFPSPSDCAAADGASGYKCVAGPSDTYLYGRLDHSLYAPEFLRDPRVREAVFLAIDVPSLTEVIGLASVPPGQLGPAGTVGFNPAVQAYSYDPARAMELVAAAEADGVDVDSVRIEVVGRDTTPQISTIVEAIGGMLNAVGIDTDVKVQVPQAFNPRVRIAGYANEPGRQMMQVHVRQNPAGDFGITLLANYACPDEDNPTGPSRSSVYCDREFDAKLFEALASVGPRRNQLLQELVKYVHDRHLVVPLALLDRAYLIDSDLEFTFGPDHRIQAAYIVRNE